WSFGNSSRSYNNILPLNPLSHLDSLIHWQVNKKLETGLALELFKNRLGIDFSWYQNRCDNQLVLFPTPLYTGFANVLTNSPANVENKGWELVLTAGVINGSALNWNITANISRNRNRLVSYPNLNQSPYYGKYQIGKSLRLARVLEYEKINPETGDYSFKDRNDNGTIENNKANEDDTYFLELTPAFFGGVTNVISYKGWQLSFLVYFKKQKGISALASGSYPGGIRNQPLSVLDRWQHPGDISNIPRFSINPP